MKTAKGALQKHTKVRTEDRRGSDPEADQERYPDPTKQSSAEYWEEHEPSPCSATTWFHSFRDGQTEQGDGGGVWFVIFFKRKRLKRLLLWGEGTGKQEKRGKEPFSKNLYKSCKARYAHIVQKHHNFNSYSKMLKSSIFLVFSF